MVLPRRRNTMRTSPTRCARALNSCTTGGTRGAFETLTPTVDMKAALARRAAPCTAQSDRQAHLLYTTWRGVRPPIRPFVSSLLLPASCHGAQSTSDASEVDLDDAPWLHVALLRCAHVVCARARRHCRRAIVNAASGRRRRRRRRAVRQPAVRLRGAAPPATTTICKLVRLAVPRRGLSDAACAWTTFHIGVCA